MRASGVPFTILRPVLIYGSGVKGNLARLMQLANTSWPLPFGLCRNRRSLLARQNLIGAIHFALQAPAALGQTYIVADPEPLTLAEIIAALRAGAGRKPGLLPVPPALIGLAANAMGRARSGSGSAAIRSPIRESSLPPDGSPPSTRARALPSSCVRVRLPLEQRPGRHADADDVEPALQ